MSIKTIFLDRDGVINKEINYLHKIEDFKFIDGVFEACQYLKSLDYKIIIILDINIKKASRTREAFFTYCF